MSTTIVDRLELDAAAETRRIAQTLRVQVGETLRRGGIVVAMSGGVDSSVCAALAVEAVGPGHVLGLGLPERESDPQSLALARDWAGRLAIDTFKRVLERPELLNLDTQERVRMVLLGFPK